MTSVLTRASYHKHLRDKPFGEHCQSLLSQHWGEIREDEVATEDEIERPWGRLRPQVLFQKYHALAILRTDAEPRSGLRECLRNQFRRNLVQARLAVAAVASTVEERLVDVGRHDR